MTPAPLPVAFSPWLKALIFSSRRSSWSKWARWSLASFGMTVTLGCDGKIVLATGAGLGSLALVFWLLQSPRRPEWRQWLRQPQGRLALAAGSGGLVSLGTYLAASAWAESEQKWLAAGLMLNGLGTLLTLALVAWRLEGRPRPREDNLERIFLQFLQSDDPLHQRLTLRQLRDYCQAYSLTPRERDDLEEYLRLLLGRNLDPLIRQDLLALLPPAPLPPLPLRQRQRVVTEPRA
ncbi:MAG: hypothetical protein GC158_13235 [Cyanobacteria bacterium RI_101]|nr:hypothetical protein [Cyanobacteria bacterium RI_101]